MNSRSSKQSGAQGDQEQLDGDEHQQADTEEEDSSNARSGCMEVQGGGANAQVQAGKQEVNTETENESRKQEGGTVGGESNELTDGSTKETDSEENATLFFSDSDQALVFSTSTTATETSTRATFAPSFVRSATIGGLALRPGAVSVSGVDLAGERTERSTTRAEIMANMDNPADRLASMVETDHTVVAEVVPHGDELHMLRLRNQELVRQLSEMSFNVVLPRRQSTSRYVYNVYSSGQVAEETFSQLVDGACVIIDPDSSDGSDAKRQNKKNQRRKVLQLVATMVCGIFCLVVTVVVVVAVREKRDKPKNAISTLSNPAPATKQPAVSSQYPFSKKDVLPSSRPSISIIVTPETAPTTTPTVVPPSSMSPTALPSKAMSRVPSQQSSIVIPEPTSGSAWAPSFLPQLPFPTGKTAPITNNPIQQPSSFPTFEPTVEPKRQPNDRTAFPTQTPTQNPMLASTKDPTLVPSSGPPTNSPTSQPTLRPQERTKQPVDQSCFEEREELEMAVRRYINRPERGSEVVLKYGYPINNWCVGRLQNFDKIFQDEREFNDNISGWDLSSAKSTKNMFHNAHRFNQDLSQWDVSRVTNMHGMFAFANDFNGNVASWDVSRVSSMGIMFYHAFEFNQDIRMWDVSKVTTMRDMFRATQFNQNLCRWGPLLKASSTEVSRMFHFTKCSSVFVPKLGGDVVSPLCHSCD